MNAKSNAAEAVRAQVGHQPKSSSPVDRYSFMTGSQHVAGLIQGDSAASLRQLPSDIFNVAVTSPPYYWVRDYGYEGQLGHEESVEAYIEKLMGVFDEVKRTLHPEGMFFLNIGDTYYSGNGQPHGSDPKCSSRNFLRIKVRPVDVSGVSILTRLERRVLHYYYNLMIPYKIYRSKRGLDAIKQFGKHVI